MSDRYLMVVGRVESVDLDAWALTGREDNVFAEARRLVREDHECMYASCICTEDRILVPISTLFAEWRP